MNDTLKPVLAIASRDRVRIDCVSGNPKHLPRPGRGYEILPKHLAIHAQTPKASGNHMLTGPIFVEGVERGDPLEVRIWEIRLRQDYGWNGFRPARIRGRSGSFVFSLDGLVRCAG